MHWRWLACCCFLAACEASARLTGVIDNKPPNMFSACRPMSGIMDSILACVFQLVSQQREEDTIQSQRQSDKASLSPHPNISGSVEIFGH